MNIIQSMINEKLGEVRIIKSEDGNPMNTLFCAVDVCRALLYNDRNITTVIKRNCRYITICEVPHPQNPEKTISMNFIPLCDVFSLIYGSRKEEAEEFRRWINEEVLPSLYQFGNYTVENHIENLEFNNPIFNPESITELSLQEQNNHITTISDYGNGMEFDNFNLTRDVCTVMSQLLQQMCNQQNQIYHMMMQNQQNIYNEINNIKTEVKEIKQMIIPATIQKTE